MQMNGDTPPTLTIGAITCDWKHSTLQLTTYLGQIWLLLQFVALGFLQHAYREGACAHNYGAT